jgi:hypothetical protein
MFGMTTEADRRALKLIDEGKDREVAPEIIESLKFNDLIRRLAAGDSEDGRRFSLTDPGRLAMKR